MAQRSGTVVMPLLHVYLITRQCAYRLNARTTQQRGDFEDPLQLETAKTLCLLRCLRMPFRAFNSILAAHLRMGSNTANTSTGTVTPPTAQRLFTRSATTTVTPSSTSDATPLISTQTLVSPLSDTASSPFIGRPSLPETLALPRDPYRYTYRLATRM